MKVCIDFGHGGESSGAVSNGLIEKDFNREAGEFLKDELSRCGIEVVLSRKNDETVELNARTQLINSMNPDYVISIHHNAGGGEGAELIHSINGGKSEGLAKAIEKRIQNLQKIHRVYSRESSRAGKDYYAIIRDVKAPSIIVEIGYMDNPKDAARISSPDFEKKMAQAIAMGFCDFTGIKYIEGSTVEKVKDTDNPQYKIIYRVQVGAFSKRENAERLVQELKEKGYSAFIKEDSLKDK